MKNKKVVWIVIGIVSVALIALAITYAYWQITKTQQGINEISAACLDISLVDAESGNAGVTLQDQYPLNDTEGAALKPYKFTVTNNCDTAVDYQIALESIGSSTDALKASSLKVMLDDTTSLLNANETVTPTIDGAYASHKLGMGTLAKSGDAGSSVTHELRLWIDEDAPVSENNKTYNGKITVTIGQGIEIKPTLKDVLLAAYGGEAAITELDSGAFETSTDESDAGMYKAIDNYGTSYYYRGNVTNNKVKFGEYKKDFYQYYNGTSAFSDLESCVEALGSEEECLTIESKMFSAGDSIYWRIVRINGDGTIRMIVDEGNSIAYAFYNTAYPYVSSNEPRTKSSIKSMLDYWYVNYIGPYYSSYIADSIFCTDYKSVDFIPQLICSNKQNSFTVNETTLGNGYFDSPVGLITADETVMAGFTSAFNSALTYLNTMGSYFWTATPSGSSTGNLYHVESNYLNDSYCSSSTDCEVRPVINLKADVEFTIDEDGTYVITTN